MLASVVDRTGRADLAAVRAAFEDVERRYAAHGLRIGWPVTVEVVRMPIMGATRSADGAHTLFASLGATRSDALAGLLAHEAGHMLRTEQGHASHDPSVYRAMGRSVRVPRAGLQVMGEAFNHVQDIYADDLTFLTGFDTRALAFFAAWIEGNSGRVSRERWANVGRSVTNGFALGNLVRHALLPPDHPAWSQARGFDRRARLEAVDGFARFFADLPPDPDTATLVERVRALASAMTLAARPPRP